MKGHLAPLKRFGQNFLNDKNILRKMADAASLSSSDVVLEIGPGRGSLTCFLARRAKKVIAVEVDRGLCAKLKEDFSSVRNVDIVCRDILKFKLRRRVKVVANLPYYITTPVIEYLFKNIKYISDIFITIQKEVAERMVAHSGTKEYGAFTCFVNYFCKPSILFKIKRDSFWPVPKVDSCFVDLKPYSPRSRPYKVVSEELFFKVVRLGFGQRRKKLLNPLSKIISKDALKKLPIGGILSERAEALSLQDFVVLSNIMKAQQG